MGQEERRKNAIVSIVIALLFIVCHDWRNQGKRNTSALPDIRTLRQRMGTPRVHDRPVYNGLIKVRNDDVSLSAPYLDKVNKHWHIGGSPVIRNNAFIRLTGTGDAGRAGSILSNGVGDNEINNFETLYDFKLSDCTGDGLVFVVASENGFIWKDLTSSYASRQYSINTNGVLPNDIGLMGFPKNLPGLAVVLDTSGSRDDSGYPLMDIYLNVNPEENAYDFESHGKYSTSFKLNDYPIRITRGILSGNQRTRLRLVYLESINFLKVDMSFSHEGGDWEQMYINQNLPWSLPKNSKTGERYLGVSSLSLNKAQTMELFNIKTNEFHWYNHRDESMEVSNPQFKEDAARFIEKEYGIVYRRHTTTPNHVAAISTKHKPSVLHRVYFWLGMVVLCITLVVLAYCISLYVRVIKKHIKRLRKKVMRKRGKRGAKHGGDSLLPI